MQSAPLPANESERLSALRDLAILDTGPENLYDDVTELASQICGTPICLVSLVDSDRQWFKSRHGIEVEQAPRELAFCAHAILGREFFEVEDSRKDERFHDNPFVTNAPNVVFYAGVPLDLGDGVNVGTLCVIDSVPKRLTEKQRTALRCLANQVVAHLRLRRANRDLQKALSAKSTFLATMSHEIRTPMNGILGITNLLIGSTRDPETREQLRIISDCGDMLLNILNDILDFSKIESGKLVLESSPFSVESVVHHVQEVMGQAAAGKGLDLRMDSGGPPDWFIGDSTRLSQVLMNLIGNAVKFTAEGEVRLTVAKTPASEGRSPASGDRVRLAFAVRDQGIGIPPEAVPNLFKSFSQVDATTTRRFGGTGLGLAICKGLVESMGGCIRVESRPGMGSVFTFELDLPLGTPPVQAEPAASGEGPIAAIKPMRILIAEDNRVNQMVAMKWTAKLGYRADLAANGIEVLRMLETKSYDLILMDCQMPEMDGSRRPAVSWPRWNRAAARSSSP